MSPVLHRYGRSDGAKLAQRVIKHNQVDHVGHLQHHSVATGDTPLKQVNRQGVTAVVEFEKGQSEGRAARKVLAGVLVSRRQHSWVVVRLNTQIVAQGFVAPQASISQFTNALRC